VVERRIDPNRLLELAEFCARAVRRRDAEIHPVSWFSAAYKRAAGELGLEKCPPLLTYADWLKRYRGWHEVMKLKKDFTAEGRSSRTPMEQPVPRLLCELCGEPSGAGGAMCPACAASR
jgi:hypothetical protein